MVIFQKDLIWIDKLIAEGAYSSRGDLFYEAIHDLINKERRTKSKARSPPPKLKILSVWIRSELNSRILLVSKSYYDSRSELFRAAIKEFHSTYFQFIQRVSEVQFHHLNYRKPPPLHAPIPQFSFRHLTGDHRRRMMDIQYEI